MSKQSLPSIQPRGLSITQAATYVGVSPNTLKKMVRLNLMPAPLKMPGMGRNVYDKLALDAAISALAVGGGA
jgi:hypothetical protein